MRIAYVIKWHGMYLDNYIFGKDTKGITSFGFDREFGYSNFFSTREEAQMVLDALDLEDAEILGINAFSTASEVGQLVGAYTVPVVHGHWITDECLPGVAVCSVCGHEIRGIGCQYTKYCDECGAKMDEVSE